jgi:hypothetical protein
VRYALMMAERAIKPLRDLEHLAECADQNVRCRMNIWWHEFRK